MRLHVGMEDYGGTQESRVMNRALELDSLELQVPRTEGRCVLAGTLVGRSFPGRKREVVLMLKPGINVLCEVALRIGTRFCPAGGGAGRQSRDCVEDGSRHAWGSVPQGRAQSLPILPHPSRRTPSTSAPEVRPEPQGLEGSGRG